MWLTLAAIEYFPTLKEIITNNIIIKLQIVSLWLLTLSLILFVSQRVIFSRFFDVKINDYNLRNDAYLTVLVALLSVLVVITVLGSENLEITTLTLPLDFSPIPGVNTPISFVMDNDSARFLMVTVFIGIMVNTMVPIYMMGEVCIKRFWNLLNAFLFSMAFLICSGNYITLLLFWELIGFFSYFLINFWKKKPSTLKSSMKAFVYNSISDVCLLVFIVTYFKTYGTFCFPTKATTLYLESNILLSKYPIHLVCLIIAISCKSAQMFFHFWLPDSMDAPAPASALIHSATLVAAGVFLLLRSKTLLINSEVIKTLCIYITAITICVGGLSATYQTDLKKILAYSTISNCGFMVYFTTTNSNLNSFLFFMTHGVFKAASFVFVGFLIVKMLHKQDSRFSGNLITNDGFISTGLFITISSLGGLPLTTMHQIKHNAIITSQNSLTNSVFVNLCISIGIITSVVYSLKIINTVILGNYNKKKYSETIDTQDSFYSKLSIVASIVFITYLTTLLSLLFLQNEILADFFDISNINNIYLETMGVESLIKNQPKSTTGSYEFFSKKIQQSICMAYLSGVLLVSVPTWSPISQKNTFNVALTAILVIITSIIV